MNHFCVDRIFRHRATLIIPFMATGDDFGGAVGLGKIGKRDHDLQARLTTVVRVTPEKTGVNASETDGDTTAEIKRLAT